MAPPTMPQPCNAPLTPARRQEAARCSSLPDILSCAAPSGWLLTLTSTSNPIPNPDESIYTESAFGENRGEGMMWISGKDLKNVSITGTGTIDGNGVAFMGKELEDSYELKPVTDFDPRPHVLTLTNIEKLVIRDITIRNSAYWTVHLIGCRDASIDGISILNNLKIRNGDGIDVDHSKDVRISNCFIESGDDCICLKNRREFEQYGSCEDVVVSNCTMTSRSCAIKIGSENMDSINRVLFTNCIIKDSNRGIGIQNRDEGTVTNVVFSNMSHLRHFLPPRRGQPQGCRLAFPEGGNERRMRRGEPHLLP